jgi:hypothetical protein
MTTGQQLVLFGFNLSIIRFVILFTWIRIFSRNEAKDLTLNRIDRLILVWMILKTFVFTILYGSIGSFVNRLGWDFDILGVYFLFRVVIRTPKDLEELLKHSAFLLFPFALLLVFEKTTRTNLFGIFGEVPMVATTNLGRLRVQGSFTHPIATGTLGAVLMPHYLALWFSGRKVRFAAFLGILSATVIVLLVSSSGPAMAYLAGVIGMGMWIFRRNMRLFRIAFVILIIALDFVMNDPVWFIFARVSALIGGHGYHRSMIIHQAVSHLDEWWLIGTNYTAHWLPYQLAIRPTMIDITNQFIAEGVNGGLLSLVLFIYLLKLCFGTVGTSLLSSHESADLPNGLLLWSLGAALAAHIVSFLSVTYYDHIIVVLYFLIAIIAACRDETEREASPKGERELTLEYRPG